MGPETCVWGIWGGSFAKNGSASDGGWEYVSSAEDKVVQVLREVSEHSETRSSSSGKKVPSSQTLHTEDVSAAKFSGRFSGSKFSSGSNLDSALVLTSSETLWESCFWISGGTVMIPSEIEVSRMSRAQAIPPRKPTRLFLLRIRRCRVVKAGYGTPGKVHSTLI